MKYEYQYLVFDSDEPTLEQIKEKLASNEIDDFESEYDKYSLEWVAEDIVKQNYYDWELWEGDNIYISVFQKGKPEEQELFCVSLSLDISFNTTCERYGLDD